MASNLLSVIRKRPRYALAIVSVRSQGCATDRWFFSGLTASKWIGLPQYEQAAAVLQKQSAFWGVTALGLGIAAFVLTLPLWPTRSNETTSYAITAGTKSIVWIGFGPALDFWFRGFPGCGSYNALPLFF